MAKQEHALERKFEPTEADKEVLSSLAKKSEEPRLVELTPDRIGECRIKARVSRDQQTLESVQIELVGLGLPYITLKGEMLSAQSQEILRVLETWSGRPQGGVSGEHSRSDALTHTEITLPLPPAGDLSRGIIRRLSQLKAEFDQIETAFGREETYADEQLFVELQRRHGLLQKVLGIYDDYLSSSRNLKQLDVMLEQRLPPCERDEATGRKDIATERMALLEKELRHHLLGAAPEHSSNAIIEIRAGAQGGDTHFRATEILLKLYRAAAERGLAEYPGGFKVEVLESEAPPKGALADGFKSLTIRIQGDGAFGLFRHEGGVHRFEMKGGGKAATVGLSVVVYPEVNELEAREFNLHNKDLEIRTSRASGKGGQHVNTTESAVRIKHLPTGVVVEIADERSQRENKAKALKILASRVKELQRKEHLGQLQGVRRAQRGLASHADAVRNYDLLNSERIKDNRLPSGNSRTLADCLRGEMIYLIRQVDLAQFDRELEEQTS